MRRSRAATPRVGALIEAAGGPDEFLERYAVILCSDHGQTTVDDVATAPGRASRGDALVTASNRAGHGLPPTGSRGRSRSRRLDGDPAVEVVLCREGDEAVARREGEELRFTPAGSERRRVRSSTIPDGLERAWAALANPNAGELLVSAAAGWEFADLGGRHHAGRRLARLAR